MFSANSSQVSDSKLFVEDVFSTYLYTGTGAAQTITNGIDLSGKGGLVWIKNRNSTRVHCLFDTQRGSNQLLQSQSTDAQITNATAITSFSSSGFSLGTENEVNGSAATFTSWTFRKAPKFFDVVTFTPGSTTINHSLGSIPGFIIIKATEVADPWYMVHRGANGFSQLNTANAFSGTGNPGIATSGAWMNCTATTFNVSNFVSAGQSYVAYLFAHDATSDGIIQCGSYTGNGVAGREINLGWEPQWVLLKNASDGTLNWFLWDNMRGFPDGRALFPNTSGGESSGDNGLDVTSTGLVLRTGGSKYNASGSTYIYMAIRRGPMRTPTLGTSVFAPVTRTGTGATVYTTTSGFAPDSVWMDARSQSGKGPGLFDRLRGLPQLLQTTTTSSEVTNAGYIGLMGNTGYTSNADAYYNTSSQTFVDWLFRRAPGFFDEVCYTGTGAAQTVNHNLGVKPELIITKPRNADGRWYAHHTFGSTDYQEQYLNQTSRQYADNYGIIFSSAPTATSYAIENTIQLSGTTYVAYLFASAPGVSKVGTYTGNGSSQTINCGFAAGARFVMIKRTDSTGDWYVWDSARGIVAGNDPYLELNTYNAEVTSNDSVDPDSSGFVVNQVAATNVNVSSATYIYLAIA